MATLQERNKEAVRSMFSSFLAQDIPGVVAHMAEEVEWEQFEVPTTAQDAGVPFLVGRKGGALPFFEALAQEVDIFKFEVGKSYADEDKVFSFLQVAATVKKTGKSYEMTEVIEWTFNEDSKVVGCRHHMDTGKLLESYRA